MSATIPISVTMLVKNSEKYLAKVLSALQRFDEIILLDNGSTDNTLTIAQDFSNVVIKKHEFIGFGPMKNLAAKFAKHDWVINIDSDEEFPDFLVEEIAQLNLNDANKVYAMLRLNHYRGKVIKTCGWYPDYVTRLYNKTVVHFNNKQVHESLEYTSSVQCERLNHHFLHYSFENADGLIQKMQQYTSLYAQQNKFKRRATLPGAIGHGLAAFLKNYLLRKGVISGRDGFVISTANALGSYYKYVKLQEENQTLNADLIITTYNRPDALQAVLQSVLVQTKLPKQVIVADDGSTNETKNIIEQYQQDFPVPLIHAWQEDTGFKLAESRNRALAKVKSEYVVIVDGDMVLHPKFMADHLDYAELGVYVQGARVMLPKEKTTEILQHPHRYPNIKWYHKGIETRFEKRMSTCHLPWLNRLLSKKSHNKYKGIRGCNMAFFLEDARAVNGFNNDFVGWGREDSEFMARLYNNGVKRKDIRYSAIAYHLYHHEAERNSLPENDKLLNKSKNENLTWCNNGLQQVKEKDA